MFKFLKEKLKSAISKISEGVEREGKIGEAIVDKPVEEPKEEKGLFAKIKEKIAGKSHGEEKPEKEEAKIQFSEPIILHEKEAAPKKPEQGPKQEKAAAKTEAKTGQKEKAVKKETVAGKEEKPRPEHRIREEIKSKAKPQIPVQDAVPQQKIIQEPKEEQIKIDEKPEKKGFFAAIREKIATTTINEAQFEKMFWEMELALMESNVAVEVIEKIKEDLKSELVEKPIKRGKVEETIVLTLRNSIEGLFENGKLELLNGINGKADKPYVIAFFGINGSGKTTSIAKLASMLKAKNISCVLAASDTFRAASIEQLQQHAERLGIKLIRHDYGSDPAAVAFDAIKHAKAKSIDVVLIDTAGRMHSNENLLAEMKKIIRVAKPDLKVFVGESITGNDCVEQAKTFNDAVGIDGIILAKADIDEKGGAAVSVSYVTKKPILFLGVGQDYNDLESFDKQKIIRNIGLA